MKNIMYKHKKGRANGLALYMGITMSHFFTMAHRKGMGVFLVVTIPKIIILGRVGPGEPGKAPRTHFSMFSAIMAICLSAYKLWFYV